MSDLDYHEGRPLIRPARDNRGVLILCPVGHFYHYVEPGAWAGSTWEAHATDPNWRVRCCGAVPTVTQ